MSTFTKEKLKNLKNAITASYEVLKPFRESSYESIQQYVGSYYGQNKSDMKKPVPINFIQLATDIYTQHIAPVCPRYSTKGLKRGLDQSAGTLELALNHLVKEIRLKDVYREAVTNAMFSMGIIKVGTSTVDRGTVIDATQPFAEVVSISDWVHDTTAKRFDQVSFCGDRVYLDYEVFKKSKLYDHTDKVNPFKPVGEEEKDDAAVLSGDTQRRDEFKEVVELWEIYLPFENKIITIPATGTPYLLREIEWYGSETGPYKLLRFNDVPDNIMPAAPVSAWKDLHTLANDLMIKIRNQASRQKDILAVSNGARDDATRVMNSSDGQIVNVLDPNSLNKMSFGGANPENFAALSIAREYFSWGAGNLDSLGGLSAQADTYGQEQIVSASSSKRMIKMKEAFLSFAQDVGESLADELWYDPNIDMPLVKEFPNSGIQIMKQFNADAKEGDFLDYNISIDPYSMTYQTPSEKLQSIVQLTNQVLIPMMPALQAQGGQVNMIEYINMIAQYSNNPELKDIIVFNDAMPTDDMEIIQPGRNEMSTYDTLSSNRSQKRVPTGGTRQFKDQQLTLAAMNYNTQPKEKQAANRMTAY